MSRKDSELLLSVLQLPEAVRAQFAREILASLDDPQEPGADDVWRDEIERRTEEVLAGNADLEDADAVHARLRARFADRGR